MIEATSEAKFCAFIRVDKRCFLPLTRGGFFAVKIGMRERLAILVAWRCRRRSSSSARRPPRVMGEGSPAFRRLAAAADFTRFGHWPRAASPVLAMTFIRRSIKSLSPEENA